MKNKIKVGSVVRVKDDPHRYVVEEKTYIESYYLESVIDYTNIHTNKKLELVQGIEAVQRGDIVDPGSYEITTAFVSTRTEKTGKVGRKMKVVEVGFNSFMNEGGKWYTFQEAKDWKIVGKEEEEAFMGLSKDDLRKVSQKADKMQKQTLEEENPQEHEVSVCVLGTVWGEAEPSATHIEIDGTEYVIDELLKAMEK